MKFNKFDGYYKAENGFVIQIIELINTNKRLYKVLNNEGEVNKFYPFGNVGHPCFTRLRDAKDFVATR